ncbi:MAG: hypothetical protein JWQ27_432 [Ferruginibacter sp.]|nr:hypothetical protein [Ferruginibacter sp.]
MRYALYFRISLLFLLLSASCLAQNITGTWEGSMDDEYLQLNIEQKNNELCGFSYDYELASPKSHCRAEFTGAYVPSRDVWIIKGVSFIENSGSHVLMQMKLFRLPEDDRYTLRARVYVSSGIPGMYSPAGDTVVLQRVSSKPRTLKGRVDPCFPEPVTQPVKPITPPVVKPVPKPAPKPLPPVIKKPVTPVPVPVKPKPIPPVIKDTPRINPQKIPVTIRRDTSQLKQMNARRKKEQSRLVVNSSTLFLKVYDNGVVDDDTVSIFYNGKLIANRQRLSEQPLLLTIELDTSKRMHEIILYAHNLGSIPPNTALIVVTAGKKRYELRSSASLEENAVLVFEYEPRLVE